MQNDKKNGIAFGCETGNPSPEVRAWFRAMQEHYKEVERKKQERAEWIAKRWVIEGNKATRDTKDFRIVVECEKNADGFKSLRVAVDDDERHYTRGSYTTADIPIEIIEQLLNGQKTS